MSTFSNRLIDRLATAERVVVLTGAGISAESGVPTFRDPGGLWQRFKPEELANVEAFLANPVLVQSWYHHRRSVLDDVEPNPGHIALRRLADLVPAFSLVTQNVDNLHQRAGSEDVIELHGNITRSYCIDCHADAVDGDQGSADQAHRCQTCGGLIRPDVVWFGEMLPIDNLERAERASRNADVFLSIGTSGVVYPAAGLPLAAADAGAYTAEINIERSAIAPYMDEIIEGAAGAVLPAIVERLQYRLRKAGT